MVPSFNNQGLSRRKFYKKLKYNIKLFDVEENEIQGEEDITNVDSISVNPSVLEDDVQVDFLD